eukprot:COSAG06_NODE_18173_length_900_cov_1.295880_1_plen_203_part_00
MRGVCTYIGAKCRDPRRRPPRPRSFALTASERPAAAARQRCWRWCSRWPALRRQCRGRLRSRRLQLPPGQATKGLLLRSPRGQSTRSWHKRLAVFPPSCPIQTTAQPQEPPATPSAAAAHALACTAATRAVLARGGRRPAARLGVPSFDGKFESLTTCPGRGMGFAPNGLKRESHPTPHHSLVIGSAAAAGSPQGVLLSAQE